jgi:hypothetical protein
MGDRSTWGNVERMVGMREYQYWSEWMRSVGGGQFRAATTHEIAGVERLAFVSEAKQELLRLIVDVQQNRNRPEGME